MPSSEVERFKKFCKLIDLKLEPFQHLIVQELLSGRRESLVLLPRGNGKSTLIAALALFHLLTRKEAWVVVGAASRDQAAVLFEFAAKMAEHPAIAKRVHVTRREMRTESGWLRVVSSDGQKQHGLVLTLAIVDELHAHVNDELHIALLTAMLKHPDCQMWNISTAGIGEESLLGKLRSRAMSGEVTREGALTKAIGDDLGMLEWALSVEANVDDAEVVKTANPASWIDAKGLAKQRIAVHDIAFRRYHCNQWVAAEAPWITADIWDGCSDDPEFTDGEEVTIGVDAAVRNDSSCVAIVRRTPAGVFHCKFRIWTPDKGREIELENVVDYIRDLAKQYRVNAVCYDPYFMMHAAQRLESEGIPMIEWRQDNARMVPATRVLHEAVTHKKLRHGGEPTVRKHALATAIAETERGIRIKKTASRDRIDAIVALSMAVDWLSRLAEEPQLSVYEKRALAAA